MLSAFANAFRTPDLRRKILFTLFILAVFRLGSVIPVPNVNVSNINTCVNQASSGSSAGLYSMISLFSGGALLKLAIFALGIMPYITASIIIQLLTVVIPRFETLKKEGQSGQAKMTQYTRYLAIALALLQSSTLITAARSPWTILGGSPTTCSTIMTDDSIPTVLLMILTLTAGTGLIMWLGEQVTERGIGNGMSLLILTAVAARVPQSLWAIHNQGWGRFIAVVIMCLAVTTAVVRPARASCRFAAIRASVWASTAEVGSTSTSTSGSSSSRRSRWRLIHERVRCE